MTTPSFAQRLAQFFDQFQDLVDLPTTTPTAFAIPIAGSGGTLAAGWLPAASPSAAGVVELATSAEAIAGTDTVRAVTPKGAADTYYRLPKTIPTSADLNSYTSAGQFYTESNGVAATISNTPTLASFTLIVERIGSLATQTLTNYNSPPQKWIRSMYAAGTWGEWSVVLHEKRPNISTLAVTSTDDATSATAAPLKSAGGLAVAGNAIIAKGVSYAKSFSYDYVLTNSCFNATGKGVRFTIPNRIFVVLNVSVLGVMGAAGGSSFMNSVFTLTTNATSGAIINQSATPLATGGSLPGLFEITITKDSESTDCFLDILRSSTSSEVTVSVYPVVNISGMTSFSSYTNAFSFVYVS